MYKFNNLVLSKLEKEDLNLLQNLKSDSWTNTHSNSIVNKESQEAWFNSLDKDPISPKNLVLLAQDKQIKIGIFKILNVNYQNLTADVGWDVFFEHRKKGWGKKLVQAGSFFSFEILNLNRLTAEILKTNIPSIKCAENTGFKLEGCKKSAVFKQNKYIDSLIYGLLRNYVFKV